MLKSFFIVSYALFTCETVTYTQTKNTDQFVIMYKNIFIIFEFVLIKEVSEKTHISMGNILKTRKKAPRSLELFV